MNGAKDDDCLYKEEDVDGVGEGPRKRKRKSTTQTSNKKQKLNDSSAKTAPPKCSGCGKPLKGNNHSTCTKKTRKPKKTPTKKNKTK